MSMPVSVFYKVNFVYLIWFNGPWLQRPIDTTYKSAKSPGVRSDEVRLYHSPTCPPFSYFIRESFVEMNIGPISSPVAIFVLIGLGPRLVFIHFTMEKRLIPRKAGLIYFCVPFLILTPLCQIISYLSSSEFRNTVLWTNEKKPFLSDRTSSPIVSTSSMTKAKKSKTQKQPKNT